jgi:hypothetical protein
VDREKQVRLLACRDGRARVERDELVGSSRQDDGNAGARQERLEAQGDVEHHLGLRDALAQGAGVVTPVPRVDDDLRRAEPKLAGERHRPASGRRRGNWL